MSLLQITAKSPSNYALVHIKERENAYCSLRLKLFLILFGSKNYFDHNSLYICNQIHIFIVFFYFSRLFSSVYSFLCVGGVTFMTQLILLLINSKLNLSKLRVFQYPQVFHAHLLPPCSKYQGGVVWLPLRIFVLDLQCPARKKLELRSKYILK